MLFTYCVGSENGSSKAIADILNQHLIIQACDLECYDVFAYIMAVKGTKQQIMADFMVVS